ncbi:hypothetical protein ACFE04_022975 [Oxalis oulophora]
MSSIYVASLNTLARPSSTIRTLVVPLHHHHHVRRPPCVLPKRQSSHVVLAVNGSSFTPINSLNAKNEGYRVTDFMTKKDHLFVLKPTTTIFNEIQKLLNKTNGKLVGDLMTPAPLVVRETTNLEDAARLLLETKYRRLPVVDSEGKLVGILTRGDVVRAALMIKKSSERLS